MMNPLNSPLLTDLYQLTMLKGYVEEGLTGEAVFEFYVRKLPENRGFLVSAGLESCLKYLENLKFAEEEITYLDRTGRFSNLLLDFLAAFRFDGDVHAMPEGTIFFPNEPILRITAPLPAAQLLETRLINLLQFETLIATKAARCVLSSAGRAVLVDFGVRRAHGAEAGLLAARASYLAGFAGTSLVIAEPFYGIPIFGTMAHSYVEAHDTEEEAFLAFCRSNPANTTLLIDTFDTLQGARRAATAAKRLAEEGISVQAVRLDSGNMDSLSREVRRILDEEGLPNIRIFVSGNMDEYCIRDLLNGGVPINGFGVGTKMDTSADVPYLECAYKLMEYNGRPRLKQSFGKATLPGRKQVYRKFIDGRMTMDCLTIEGDIAEGESLIAKVMKHGKRIMPSVDLQSSREYAEKQLAALPEHLGKLGNEPSYPVKISPVLTDLQKKTEKTMMK